MTYFPCYSLGEVASSLHDVVYEMGWVLMDFDWPSWVKTDEAIRRRDEPDRLAQAMPDQLARLLTVLFRQERFCEGSLAAAHDSGLLIRILKRASDLETEEIKNGVV